jgi:hypothetical protein
VERATLDANADDARQIGKRPEHRQQARRVAVDSPDRVARQRVPQELVLDVAKHFRVKAARAKEIVGEVETAVGQWRVEAKRAGILRAEQDRMARAFRLADGGA